jgi:FlaA1/EpsC-like NDP-sugar epimerase
MVAMAERYDVGLFVFISTDKAVRPTSLMGATKRVSELITQSYAGRGKTRFITVRFGNVVGSGGSVAPLFIEQIKRGGPVTVTDPNVTRFFMSIKEAVLLVLQAASMGKGGEVFLLDMGRPIKILNMAEDLIRLAGKQPYKDIDIIFTGLRPGEKLSEELLVDGETSIPTRHPKIYTAKANGIDSNKIESLLAALRDAADRRDISDLTEALRAIIPDYHPSEFLTGTKTSTTPKLLRTV